MKKALIVIIILVLLSITSIVFMLIEKNKLDSINKEIKNYITDKENLQNKINNFETEKEQVEKDLNENIDKDKLSMYEIWVSQNKYLDESL